MENTTDQQNRPAAFEITVPKTLKSPLVFASPHSGRYYPASFLAASRLDPTAIRKSEDCYVDELFATSFPAGAPLIRANYARAYLDLNREAYELDPAMFRDALPDHVNTGSERVAAGLGTLARIVAIGTEIYAEKLYFTEAESRIRRIYFPYHKALAGLLATAKQRFGQAALIDCHSMPSGPEQTFLSPSVKYHDFVLGDRSGESCHPALIDIAAACLKKQGYKVARNDPYQGGYCCKRYGRPDDGLHALQIEINRSLYIDEVTLEKKPYFATLASDIGQMITALTAIDLAPGLPQAAE